MTMELTHFDPGGKAWMVDVSDKEDTRRTAVAEGRIRMSRECFDLVSRGSAAKGKTGFGLGLYLVRSYMEKQGGGVEVYNDGGFVVELYLKKV